MIGAVGLHGERVHAHGGILGNEDADGATVFLTLRPFQRDSLRRIVCRDGIARNACKAEDFRIQLDDGIFAAIGPKNALAAAFRIRKRDALRLRFHAL